MVAAPEYARRAALRGIWAIGAERTFDVAWHEENAGGFLDSARIGRRGGPQPSARCRGIERGGVPVATGWVKHLDRKPRAALFLIWFRTTGRPQETA